MTGIDPKQLLKLVIDPTLKKLKKDSRAASQIVLLTAAHESAMGHYIHQINGPALGIYQIEPNTHYDIYKNYLMYQDDLLARVDALSSNEIRLNRENELVTNLAYSTAIARLIYARQKEALPEYDDIYGMAVYWKNYYNTVHGKGTIDEFVDNYNRYVKGKI